MIWYYDYAFKYANYKDDKTKKYQPRTLIPYSDQVQYYIITVGYSAGLTVLQIIMVKICTLYTIAENHRH